MEQLSIFATSDPPQSPSSGSECWILVQQNDGCDRKFFNRDWSSYREGFGDASGNYWIGNEHLHQITQLLHQGLQFTICSVTVSFKVKLFKLRECQVRYGNNCVQNPLLQGFVRTLDTQFPINACCNFGRFTYVLSCYMTFSLH